MSMFRPQIALALLLIQIDGIMPANAPAECAGDRPVSVAAFVPDSASVQRYGPAYRYPQAGWIVLHIEGQPYERGVQHGRLMAPEITDIVHAAAVNQSPKAPEDGWNQMRLLVDALFLRRYDEEFLLEMKGIADGATAAGAKFEGRPIDLVDVVAVNAWTEVEFLEAAMRATPQGLESIRFRDLLPTPVKAPPPDRCSSFIANGPATADGKIVFGHITMWSLQPARHFNVWLDILPTQGHRLLMQTFPGGIQSTMDYYMNDAGLLVSETTISQTRFNSAGKSEASRIRRALQNGSSIDDVVRILKTDNNGLYSNEWLMGDTRTNEIAMFELGTFRSRLWRSSQEEWFGGTPGFYWGCNNPKDVEVRLETVPSLVGRPANMVFRPSDRDLMWQRLYLKHRGKISAEFGFEAFTTTPLAAAHSLDAKFTTADMARELKTYALFGPPLGRTWEPSEGERQRYGDQIKPLVSNGWTILDAIDPTDQEPRGRPRRPTVVDLVSSGGQSSSPGSTKPYREAARPLESDGAAWHGTILPQDARDIWLATAFADYERIVANERALGGRPGFVSLSDAGRDATNLALFPYRSTFLLAARALPTTSLATIQTSNDSNLWYDFAVGKGIFALQELRGRMGAEKFDDFMDSFGRDHAGIPTSTEEFRTRAEEAAGQSLAAFLDQWIRQSATLSLRLRDVERTGNGSDWHVRGYLDRTAGSVSARIELALETDKGPVSHILSLADTDTTQFDVSSPGRPRRLLVDPANRLLKENGPIFTIHSFHRDLDKSLIVHGTGPEHASLREAAELLQKRIAAQWSNYLLPIRSDREVKEEELRSHHLLLVGRPAMNSVSERFSQSLPVQFGLGSFQVADQTYANPGSAVISAGLNPVNSDYSIVLFAGLSAESTRRLVLQPSTSAEVQVFPAKGASLSYVLPARDLMIDFADAE